MNDQRTIERVMALLDDYERVLLGGSSRRVVSIATDGAPVRGYIASKQDALEEIRDVRQEFRDYAERTAAQ